MKFFYKVFSLFVAFTAISLFFSTPTYATHFRSGTMSWSHVSDRTVLIKVNIGYTNDHGFIPADTAVGEVVTNNFSLNFGDEQSQSVAVRVVSRNTTTNDVQVEAVSIKEGDDDYTVGILHTYATDGDYTAFWGSSTRESAINLDGTTWRNETLINIGGDYTGNSSPTTAVSSVIQVQDNTVFTTSLVGVDTDGDDVRFRYGTKQEFYGSGDGEATRPTGLVLEEDGSISWDVRDGTLATNIGDRWQGTIMVEDLDEEGGVKSKVPLDFVFLISDSSDLPPTITGPDSSTYTISPSQTLNFSLSTNDPDWEAGLDSPTLTILNPPSTDNSIWSTSSSQEEGDTEMDVTFTPDNSFADSSYVVIFQATDDGGNASTKTVTINVEEVAPTPTPQPQQIQTSSSPGRPSVASCTNANPGSTPDLFQIDTTNSSATLYFSPSSGQVAGYTVSYGTSPDAGEYAVSFDHSDQNGVVSYTINSLYSGTWYFKVSGHNVCMPGEWSNQMEVALTDGGQNMSHYKNFVSQVLSVLPSNVSNAGSTEVLGASTSGQNPDSCEYTVVSGDNLWNIATEQLGSGARYPEIMEENNLQSTFLHTGQILKVGC